LFDAPHLVEFRQTLGAKTGNILYSTQCKLLQFARLWELRWQRAAHLGAAANSSSNPMMRQLRTGLLVRSLGQRPKRVALAQGKAQFHQRGIASLGVPDRTDRPVGKMEVAEN
jgi:hypothetical protein